VTLAGVSTGDITVRDLLSSMRALQVLSMVMTDSGSEDEILDLAVSSVPSVSRCRAEAVWLDGEWRSVHSLRGRVGARADLEGQVAGLGRAGGPLDSEGLGWAWAYPLSSRGGASGYLVVGSPGPPPDHERSVIQALAQQTGVALANARLLARERATASELRTTLGALRRSLDIHARLTRVAAAGEGLEGIARAVHELTGHGVAIEDRAGNLQAWAGPDRPDPYPRETPTRRERTLQQAQTAGRPVRKGGRVLALALSRDDIFGVVALIDPKGSAREAEHVALEHGATVLAMELARLRSLAETELRLGRDLLDELLAGHQTRDLLKRARALGYDLDQVHRVVVVEGDSRNRDEEYFFHAVRRCARDTGIGSLLGVRAGTVVILAGAAGDWERLRTTVLSDMGRGICRVGVGGPYDSLDDLPRSYREAQMALKTQKAARLGDRATVFDDLGVYRILSGVDDPDTVERYVRDWLGALLDYDGRKDSELVATLSGYLECGGSYAGAAKALSVHRSTLRYRLERIREVSGHDLGDPDTRFNLQLATRAWATLQAMRQLHPRPDQAASSTVETSSSSRRVR
jgi:sugar diacid utilization regulator